jgi:LCP family protein required for cell wall assembly
LGKDSKRARPGAPRWARVCAWLGAALMVVSAGVLVTSRVLLARYASAVQTADLFGDQAAAATVGELPAEPKHRDITGPLNILLVGIDPREPEAPPLADSIIIAHVPASMDHVYVFSIPRDTWVRIPEFAKANWPGGKDKINGAMAHGSKVPGELPSAVRGFELLSKTVSELTGIDRFDAGAIVNFDGFKKVVDAMGGVDMIIDEETKSEHLRPDGTPRTLARGGGSYLGPQKVYAVGKRHMSGWEALDYVRQRKSLKDGDYGRQRHQQQFLKAMAAKATSGDMLTSPTKLDAVLRAGGESLIFNGRGNSVVDFAFALKGIRSDDITMVKLQGGGVYSGGAYLGEQLNAGTDDFFDAVADDRVEAFLAGHQEYVNHAE